MSLALQLVALGVATMLWGGGAAAPITPDFSSCGVHAHSRAVNCCTLPELMRRPPGPYKEWAQYLRESDLVARRRQAAVVRRAAHLQEVGGNRTYLRQLDRAYARMRALPQDDPRSLFQQNMYHCMYGGIGVTKQLGFPGEMYNIHFSWLFWPYHRMFTFFFERILGELVGDDTLALPFWNWDNQAPLEPFLPNALPHFVRDPERYPALYDPNRHPRHRPGEPPAMADLVFDSDDPDYVPAAAESVREANNEQLRKYIVEAAPAERFLGYPIRAGEPVDMERRTFETMVHGKIHMWLGDAAKNGEDMGQGYAAVLDPLFFLHHANVDRIWGVWQASLGRGQHHDPDYLDAEMFFYDEHAQLVRATVRDCLASSALIAAYQEVDNPWLLDTHNPIVPYDKLTDTMIDAASTATAAQID